MPQPLDFLRRNSLVSSESAAILNSRSGKHDYKSRSSAASAALGSGPSSGHPSLPDELDPGVQIELSAAVAGVVPDDSFTVEQAVNALGFGKFQMRLSFMTGLCWMADSMEMMILSVLSPALHCEWGLSQWRQAFMTAMVFFGMMLSAPFWGNFSDKYGRKMGLLIAAWLLFYYGILSSTAPTYIWLILLRSLVGFAIGCVPQSVTLYAEFLPQTQRAKCVILLDCFWALGACLEVILALFVMPAWGWRAFLAISSLPVLLYCLVCFWMPESARFHAASGQSDKALATLKKIADENGKPMLLGRLIVDDGAGPGGGSGYSPWRRGRFSDLLMPELKWTSLLLWFIWFTCAFCYYGVVLMTTELFEVPSEQMCGAIDTQDQESCSVQCKALTTKDYLDLLWTTLAEFPGIFLTLLIIEKVGRKQTMAIELVAFALTLSMLFICYPGRPFLTVLLFTARGAVSGVFQAAYVYTPEVYPTSLRAVGVGTCSGAARFGAMVTPFIAQVLLRTSLSLATATYAGLACLAAVACMLLPIETKGRQLDGG